MENKELMELWWSSLPIAEKERIALKGLQKAGDPDQSKATYPACTTWWNSLAEATKTSIYSHCVAAHGDELKEWREEKPYGD